MGLAPTLTYERALSAFLAAQLTDGSFLGPERGRPESTATDANDEDAAFRRRYHTTLVGVLALCTRNMSAAPRAGDPARQERAAHRRLRSPDVSAALTKAAHWFQETLELIDLNGELDTRAATRLLTGLWICEQLNLLGSASFSAAAEPVRQALHEHAPQPSGVPAPAALIIIAFGLLRRQDLQVPALDNFISRARQALGDVHTIDAPSDLHYCEKRLLLNVLGLHPPPLLLSRDELLRTLDATSLPLSRTDLTELLRCVNSFAGYGTVAQPEPVEEQILDLLDALANNALRTYDLESGARLIRALGYLDGGARAEHRAMFLCQHQRPEGSFGYLDTEIATITSAGLNARTELELPFTLASTWALAELFFPPWRLMTSFGSIHKSTMDR